MYFFDSIERTIPKLFVKFMSRKTKEAITPSNWYRTGDLGRMRPTGHLEIVGRIKDMIARGGEKIFPAEVEAFLYTHPNVAEAYVIGAPDERLGEEVCTRMSLHFKFTIQMLISTK